MFRDPQSDQSLSHFVGRIFFEEFGRDDRIARPADVVGFDPKHLRYSAGVVRITNRGVWELLLKITPHDGQLLQFFFCNRIRSPRHGLPSSIFRWSQSLLRAS